MTSARFSWATARDPNAIAIKVAAAKPMNANGLEPRMESSRIYSYCGTLGQKIEVRKS